MITFVNLLVRREELSHEEFVDRWRGDHVELARALPGLEAYETSVPTDPSRSTYDGIVRLTFPDHETMSAAFDSAEGEAVQADAASFADMDRSEVLIVDTESHLEEEHGRPDRTDGSH